MILIQGDGELEYSTAPITTDFEHDEWDSYQVIGFMAERYFAAYTINSTFADDPVNMMARGQLSKILIDNDDKKSVYSGSSLLLEEGYALNIIELDRDGNKVFMSLTKDGAEVDEGIVSSGATYVYEKDLGSVDNVPVIAVYFSEIFSGIETNAVFVEGIFQISDEYLELESGDRFGAMEIDSISDIRISMVNDETISLAKGHLWICPNPEPMNCAERLQRKNINGPL